MKYIDIGDCYEIETTEVSRDFDKVVADARDVFMRDGCSIFAAKEDAKVAMFGHSAEEAMVPK